MRTDIIQIKKIITQKMKNKKLQITFRVLDLIHYLMIIIETLMYLMQVFSLNA